MESFSLGVALFGLFAWLILACAAIAFEAGPEGIRLVYPLLLRRLAARAGINLAEAPYRASRRELTRAIDSCRFCSVTDTCRAWQDGNDRPESYRLFCPNAVLLERLARREDGSRRTAIRRDIYEIDKVLWPV